MQTIGNYINGEIVAPAGGAFLDNVEPATGQVYSQVPDSDERDVSAAIEAAQAAFATWSTTPAEKRCAALLRIADLLEANLEAFARAESVDTGKPITRARVLEIPRAVKNFRFFASAILHERSDLHVMDRDAINYTLRRPRGVCGLISPWNLPLYLLTWKVAPALAVGATAVAKPSELTPMTAHLLAQICMQAGLPPGVLNIVHGNGPRAGAALVADPRVSTISFTGGTRTGGDIARVAAPLLKKLSLELGGKNPTIVFADADPDAIDGSVQAAFSNQGQICLCGSRLFVEEAIYRAFVERFVEKTRQLRLGDPLDEATQQGALVSAAHRDKVESYVQLARAERGRILCGGHRPTDLSDRCGGGYFFEPTVIVDLPASCRVNQEEIFGPVVSIIPFVDERDVITAANGVPYGLSASIWTSNLSRAHRVADQLAAGTVWVNCWLVRDLRVPFGGTKQSGVGREGGDEALRFFTEPKNVCIRTPSN
ncbi:2-aminomuconic 6-semialdehyde dehydrogenase [Phycisphaerae bacterium RAS1]|nr:2-aminomuconic 6-semialdehyde dehydrogenase [Phycisphaerae bacterium RAS1]